MTVHRPRISVRKSGTRQGLGYKPPLLSFSIALRQWNKQRDCCQTGKRPMLTARLLCPMLSRHMTHNRERSKRQTRGAQHSTQL